MFRSSTSLVTSVCVCVCVCVYITRLGSVSSTPGSVFSDDCSTSWGTAVTTMMNQHNTTQLHTHTDLILILLLLLLLLPHHHYHHHHQLSGPLWCHPPLPPTFSLFLPVHADTKAWMVINGNYHHYHYHHYHHHH